MHPHICGRGFLFRLQNNPENREIKKKKKKKKIWESGQNLSQGHSFGKTGAETESPII